MSAMGTTTLLTFEEFKELPDAPGKRELLRGELIELPPAKKEHNKIAERIYQSLFAAAEKLRRERPDMEPGEVHHEMGYRVARDPDSWLQPDVSLTHPGQAGEDYYEGAPALAVEIVSESNTAEQVEGKVKDYMAHGAREVWVVYPKMRSLRVHRGRLATDVEGELKTELLPGFSISLSLLLPQ